MATTNHDRVGKALDLLRAGLGPFVEREVNSAVAALSYNGLVQSWPEISRLAQEAGRPGAEQTGLFGED